MFDGRAKENKGMRKGSYTLVHKGVNGPNQAIYNLTQAGIVLSFTILPRIGGQGMAGERILNGLRKYRQRYKKPDKAGRSRLLG